MTLKPFFQPSPNSPEPPSIQNIISALALEPHIEGGYYRETDRSSETIPSPFPSQQTATTDLVPQRPGFDPERRDLSTTIYYLLTPNGPQGGFHRNASRTVHTLHHGRGTYAIIHADAPSTAATPSSSPKPVETFTVGHDVAAGEKLQWIVEGGKYKASFLLPDAATGGGEGSKESEKGLLISETVVPGFEFCDHDFLTEDGLRGLVGEEKAEELKWLLSPLGKQ